MGPLPLPARTLKWLAHAEQTGQSDAQVLLHLLNRADANDQDVAKFLDHYSRFLGSYSKTIAALCCRLDALERGANLHKQDDDVEVAQSDSVADDAERIIDPAAKAGPEDQDWARLFSAATVPRQAPAATPTSAAPTPSPAALAGIIGYEFPLLPDGKVDETGARAVIHKVAAWLDIRGQHGCSALLREEIDQ